MTYQAYTRVIASTHASTEELQRIVAPMGKREPFSKTHAGRARRIKRKQAIARKREWLGA